VLHKVGLTACSSAAYHLRLDLNSHYRTYCPDIAIFDMPTKTNDNKSLGLYHMMEKTPPAYHSLNPHGGCEDGTQFEQEVKHGPSSFDHSAPCPSCSTPTPRLDAFLNDESIQRDFQAFTDALTTLVVDVKAAKRASNLTHEDKKELKAELKGLAKEFKREIKAARRASNSVREGKKGLKSDVKGAAKEVKWKIKAAKRALKAEVEGAAKDIRRGTRAAPKASE